MAENGGNRTGSKPTCLAFLWPSRVRDILRITGNEASSGGGVSGNQWGGSAGHLFVAGNVAAGSGGGLKASDSTVVITALVLTGNQAGSGGGAYLSGGAPLFEQATIHGNYAESVGGVGGVHQFALVSSSFGQASLTGNSGGSAGGGAVEVETGSAAAFEYCNIFGNSSPALVGIPDPAGSDGNVSVDPQFLRTSPPPSTALAWDLHLAVTSPLVDAGDPSVLDPDGSPSDIGAYGGPGADQWDLDGDGYPSWWQPGPYDFGTYPALGWDCDDLDATVFPGSGC